MLPFYIYYSIFGFQRVADLIWAAGDSRARGFLIGGTAGRTTLSGEGLQHQDGSSHLVASTVPNCRAWDPCYGYELAAIVEDGARRMLDAQEDVFYYVTAMNENYVHPPMPQGAREGILRGMYLLRAAKNADSNAPHSSARTLPTTAVWWLMRRSANRSTIEPQAPVLGSRAPNTRRAMRACMIAPAHIAQGSSVTYKEAAGRR